MELLLSILLTCLPALRAFLRKYVVSIFTRSLDNSTTGDVQKQPHRPDSILITKDTDLDIKCAGIGSPDTVDRNMSTPDDEIKLWWPTSVPLGSPVMKMENGRVTELEATKDFAMSDSKQQR